MWYRLKKKTVLSRHLINIRIIATVIGINSRKYLPSEQDHYLVYVMEQAIKQAINIPLS